jgi:hypothetical protein
MEENFGGLGAGQRIILKWILGAEDVKIRKSTRSKVDRMTDLFEHIVESCNTMTAGKKTSY